MFETGELTPRFIINFPTKRHWRDLSRLADIDSGLSALVAQIERHRIHSIALPPLGWRTRRSRVDRGEAPHPPGARRRGVPGYAGLRAVRHQLAGGAEVTGG